MADSEDDGAGITEVDVHISLHALTGVTSGDTIRIGEGRNRESLERQLYVAELVAAESYSREGK
jgi:hypothetical protein